MRKGNTKERLIKAALELFSQKGYEGTTVEELAGYAGIKAPTMYKYIAGKEALLQELIERTEKEYNEGMERGHSGGEEINSGAELKEFALRSVYFTINNETTVKMRRLFTIEQFRSEIFAQSATRHQVETLRATYTAIFKRMMDNGLMIKGDADIIALEFTAPVTLMIQMSDRQPDRKAEALETIVRHFDVFVEKYCLK